MKASWNGVTIAESDDTVVVEGDHYFPEASLDRQYLTFSNHRSGSTWKGKPIGSVGDICTFSFHPNKNMTTIEGGALVVNDDAEAGRVDALRFHGITWLPDRTRDVAFPGGKFNLPDVNASIGSAQLDRLPEFLATRRALVAPHQTTASTTAP